MDSYVSYCKDRATGGMEYFLRNFSKVPDDKLTWKATPTSKSALRIAAHTALYAARFAKMISDRKVPQPENLDEWLAQRNAEEEAITSRDEIEAIFKKGTEEVVAAMNTLTPEDLELSLDSAQGWSMSMRDMLTLPGFHAIVHAGQIDFLQTCWDDQEIYVG